MAGLLTLAPRGARAAEPPAKLGLIELARELRIPTYKLEELKDAGSSAGLSLDLEVPVVELFGSGLELSSEMAENGVVVPGPLLQLRPKLSRPELVVSCTFSF